MGEVAHRLAPGHHLYVGADGVWRCRTAEDVVIHVTGARHLMARVQRVLHGEADLADVCSDEDERTVFLRLLDGFAAQGLLAGPPVRSADRSGRPMPRVLVEGDNPVASLVVDLLGPHATVVRGEVESSTLKEPDAVVSVAGWLPDAHWQRLDGLCGERGIIFHRSHVEGTRFFIGPAAVPGVTVKYSDVRARQLAAADRPDELAEFWAYLDRRQSLPAVPWPTSASGLAVVAGVLASDVLGCLGAARAHPGPGYQIELDLANLAIRWHPVLPIPGNS